MIMVSDMLIRKSKQVARKIVCFFAWFVFFQPIALCYADDNTIMPHSCDPDLRVSTNSIGKEGIIDYKGTWVIEPIYDQITYDSNVFWLILRPSDDTIPRIGLWNPKTNARLQTIYVDIRIGPSIIVACCPYGFDVYDCYGSYLMFISSDEWEEVFPLDNGKLEVMDINCNFYTLDPNDLSITNSR